MSPEQVRGYELDARTDLFSFGVVLYEMATGKRAFVGATSVEICSAILHDQPPPAPEVNPHVSQQLEVVLRKTLAKNRHLRYHNAGELRSELEQLKRESDTGRYAGMGGDGTSITRWKHSSSKNGPRKSMVLMAAVAIIAVVAVVLSWMSYRQRAYQGTRNSEVIPFRSVRLEKLTESGSVAHSAISADGKNVAYVTNEDGEQQSLRMRRVAQDSETQILTPVKAKYAGLSFSPNGDFLYFVRHYPQNPDVGVLYRTPTSGGTPELLVDDVDSNVSFSPDGSEIVFVRDRNEERSMLVIAHIDGTRERVLASRTGSTYDGPAWSPDGKRVAIVIRTLRAENPPRMEVLNVGNGEEVATYTLPDIDLRAHLDWTPDGRNVMFVFWDKTRSQLGAMSLESGKIHQVTSDLNDYVDFSLSRDGRHIVATAMSTEHELYTMNLRPGRDSTPSLVGNHLREGRWLPAGRLLAVDDEGQIIAIDPDGTNRRLLLPNGHADGGISACPDGRQVIYASMGDVWRLDLQTLSASKLPNGVKSMFPVCSPDNRRVAYVTYIPSVDGKPPKEGLTTTPIVGGQGRQLTDKSVYSSAFAPNGQEVAVETTGIDNRSEPTIDVLPVDGGQTIKSFEAPKLSLLPSGIQYSQDGKYLYYGANMSWVGNIMMQPLSGGVPTTVTSFHDKILYGFEYDWKHQRVVIERGTREGDVVLISDGGSDTLK
jgi:Tol biopolymer transport system component